MIGQLGILRRRDTSGAPPITGNTLQIGFGTTRVYGILINSEMNYSKNAVIYTAAELGGAKTITEIEMYFRSYTTPVTLNNQSIRLSHVVESEFPITASADLSETMNITDTVTVKTPFTLNINSNNQWYSFPFTTNFVYNGTSNLLVEWDQYDGSGSVGTGGTDGATYTNKVFQANASSLPITGGSRSSNRPNIKIHY